MGKWKNKNLNIAESKLNLYLNDFGDEKPHRYNALVYLMMTGVKWSDAIVVIADAYVEGRLLE